MTDTGRGRGELLARGNTSDIYAWSPTTVVKVLRPGIPDHWASIEADIIWRVHAAGLPVPATDGIVEVDGRPGIVLERIDGETMWERMRGRPAELPALVETLVELQAQMHATAVEGVPDLARRLGSKIDDAVQLPAGERREAQAILARRPTGSALCHGDVHPANVVLRPDGPVVLDWFDAAAGDAAADLARSSILMRPPLSRAAWPAHLPGATGPFLDRLHCAYLAAVFSRGLIDQAAFAEWEVVVAVARLSEPVPSADLLATWKRWQTSGTGSALAMIERCLGRAGRG